MLITKGRSREGTLENGMKKVIRKSLYSLISFLWKTSAMIADMHKNLLQRLLDSPSTLLPTWIRIFVGQSSELRKKSILLANLA